MTLATPLTFEQLLECLQALTPEQRQMTATVWDQNNDEFMAVYGTIETDETCGILDPGHPVILT